MLTLAVAFLFFAIFAAVLGSMVAGPVGLIVSLAGMLGFVATLAVYLRRRHGPPPPPAG